MLAENGEVTDRQVGRFREFLDGCGQWKDQDHAARAAMVAMLGQQAESIGFSLFIRGWHIYQVPPILVTCEEPVVAHSRATTSARRTRGCR